MKKSMSLIMTLLLAVVLVGCTPAAEESAEVETTEESAVVETESEVAEDDEMMDAEAAIEAEESAEEDEMLDAEVDAEAEL